MWVLEDAFDEEDTVSVSLAEVAEAAEVAEIVEPKTRWWSSLVSYVKRLCG